MKTPRFLHNRVKLIKDCYSEWELRKAALEWKDGPCIIEAVVEQHDNVFPMVPAGANITDPAALTDCILDVGCTGDPRYAESHVGRVTDAGPFDVVEALNDAWPTAPTL